MSDPNLLLPALAFYFFAGITLGAATMVIVARNPVHCVLFLILAFFSSAGLFLLNGAEFLAMILVIVYVGAVAVLFMFVVMMLDIDLARIREGFHDYLPVGAVIGLVLLAELIIVLSGWTEMAVAAGDPVPNWGSAEALGSVLYTQYVYVFQAAGLILLVAMIGAIVLTLRRRPDVRRQDITAQVNRQIEESIELKKPDIGQGVDF